MSGPLFGATCMALALCASAHARPVTAQNDVDRAQVAAVVDSLIQAYSRADVESVLSFYAEDASVLTAEGRLSGPEIEAALQYHFRLLAAQTFALEEIESHVLSRDSAITWMIGTTAGVDRDGVVIFEGRVVVSIHWVRESDAWRIAMAQEDLIR